MRKGLLRKNTNHRQVCLGIGSHQFRIVFLPVGQKYFNLGRSSCYMMVCEDMALRVNDHSRTESLHLSLELLGHLGDVKETSHERIALEGQKGISHLLALSHFDVRYSRDISLCHLDNGRTQIDRSSFLFCSLCGNRPEKNRKNSHQQKTGKISATINREEHIDPPFFFIKRNQNREIFASFSYAHEER